MSATILTAQASLRALSKPCRIPASTRKHVFRRSMATSGSFKIPKPFNEKNLNYEPGSIEREGLSKALGNLKAKLPVSVPPYAGTTGASSDQANTVMPGDTAKTFATYTPCSKEDISTAIESALKAKHSWMNTPFADRAAIFLRAAELVAGKYRFDLMAATMLGQGKNAWQAEIDAAAELADFYRFNVGLAEKVYDQQPELTAPGMAGRIDWRPLEGFVYSVSPFNFTAIGGNLISGPALMGNVVVWKPSPSNVYASWLVYQILLEAGLPKDVIQFVSGDAEMITETVFAHREFSAFNFTGSSDVFRSLIVKAAEGIGRKQYRDFPRYVAETSGKNFHLVHASADIPNAVKHTIRASFEYAGQKCSACSRIYVPESRSKEFIDELKNEMRAVKVGDPEDYSNFTGPVIHQAAFERVTKAIDESNKDSSLETLFGGTYDNSKGLYITPTAYLAKDINHKLFDIELFGPVLVINVYPDAEFEKVLDVVDTQGGGFALTGSIFARDQTAIRKAEDRLRYAAGNFYTNCKTTGAVIGQQTFGGGRSSGTNDKAGSANTLMRFTSPRTLKEEFAPLDTVLYPSNLERSAA